MGADSNFGVDEVRDFGFVEEIFLDWGRGVWLKNLKI